MCARDTGNGAFIFARHTWIVRDAEAVMGHERADGTDAMGVAETRNDHVFDALVESRALWKDLCETIGDFIFETDRDGRFTFLWPPECLGWTADDLIGRPASLLLATGRSAMPVFDPFRPCGPTRLRHAHLRSRDGHETVVAISSRPTSRGGTRGVGIDVTASEELARLIGAPARIRNAVDRILENARGELLPSAMLRSALGATLPVLSAEGAALLSPTIAGEEFDASRPPRHGAGGGWDVVGPLLSDLATPLAAGAIGAAPALAGRASGTVAEARMLRADERLVLLAPIAARLGPSTVLAIWRPDATGSWSTDDRAIAAGLADALRHLIEAETLQTEVARLGRNDLLTGLPDRGGFAAAVERRFARLDRDGQHGSILSADLDDFRAFNARHGLDAGDAVLREAGARLRDAVRPTDVVGRVGGDVFALWLDGADGFAAAERADAICRTGLEATLDGMPLRLTFSVGLAARTPRGSEDVESLLRRSTVAMRAAKRGGKARWTASCEEIGS